NRSEPVRPYRSLQQHPISKFFASGKSKIFLSKQFDINQLPSAPAVLLQYDTLHYATRVVYCNSARAVFLELYSLSRETVIKIPGTKLPLSLRLGNLLILYQPGT
ncbi:MAG: hypothetical protein P8X39_13255, partial [Desulfofustis sp.]